MNCFILLLAVRVNVPDMKNGILNYFGDLVRGNNGGIISKCNDKLQGLTWCQSPRRGVDKPPSHLVHRPSVYEKLVTIVTPVNVSALILRILTV